MNVFTVYSIWSFRRELKLIALAFLIVLSLPLIAVLVITQVGISAVSDALVSTNANKHTVQILNPADGSVVATVDKAITWPLVGRVTLEFGESSLYQPFHTGIDIATKQGDPITTFMEGKVVYSGEIAWGYGKHVIVDNGNNLQSIYAHLSQINVTEGQLVKPGDVIGYEGKTGWSTGSHLHFQINVFGIPVNPRVFLSNIQ